jgi:23S rRNA (uracil1939-C5)-methyltransferase
MKATQQKNTPELITIDVNSLSHDGRGIANVQGKTIFISGAIPQEKVICKITKKHSRFNEGEVVEVLEPAPERVQPECQHFNVCGGCSMQHINVEAQIQLKQKILLEQLLHFGKVTPESVLQPITGNPLGYRRKARLGVRYVRKKEKVLVGFREKFSNFLTDVQSCPVLDVRVGTKITALSELVASLSQFEHIPQIEVAGSDQEMALVFRHMTDLSDDDIQKLKTFGKTHQFHIFLQPNSPARVHKIWPEDQREKLFYLLPAYQLEMEFYPLDFIQVNAEINQLMLSQALALLDPQADETVLDLFCGLGNFTLPIARFAQQVTGVEGSQEMVLRAQENAKLNQINNADFYSANLVEPSAQSAWMQKKYDSILLDPPRTGAKEIIDFFPHFGAKRIVYVSCNPATLARDAGILVYNQGYKLKQVGVVNMFPHTSHIEAIALFEK